VLIIIPDSTRTAPIPQMFRLFYEALGKDVAALDYLIALGTHKPMDQEAIRIETPVEREVLRLPLAKSADVPLAQLISSIIDGSQQLGNGDATVVETRRVRWSNVAPVLQHVTDTGLVRVQSGEQGSARGATTRGVVELGEAQSAGGKGVQIWRWDL